MASYYVNSNGNLLTEDTGYNSAGMEIYQKIGTEYYFVIESQEDLEYTYVLANDVTNIPGLFAAGEVIGSREYRLTGAYGGGCGTGYATG